MLAASKRLKQFSHWQFKLGISAYLTCSCCRKWNGIILHGKRIRDFSKFLNGYIFNPLQRCRNYQEINCIPSIQVKGAWICPFSTIIMSNSVGYCQAISTQTSSTEVEVADEVLNQILSDIENAPSSIKEICSSYIDKLCKAKNISAAIRLLQLLRDKHIFLGPRAYNLLLEAAGEANDIDILLLVFKDVILSTESLSSTYYFNFTKAFAKTNDSVLLLQFVREVSELRFPRSATVINRIIYAFADCKQVDKALLVFDNMKNLKCKPDLITYNTVLGILGKASRIDEMLHEFASMKDANIAPDIISYNTLLNSFRKVGRLDLCLEYLKEMGERGVEPDLRSYTAIIESFGRSGNIEESLRLFDEMKQKQICPSIYIYRSLINYFKKMGKLELANIFSEEMNACLPKLVGPKDFKRKHR